MLRGQDAGQRFADAVQIFLRARPRLVEGRIARQALLRVRGEALALASSSEGVAVGSAPSARSSLILQDRGQIDFADFKFVAFACLGRAAVFLRMDDTLGRQQRIPP